MGPSKSDDLNVTFSIPISFEMVMWFRIEKVYQNASLLIFRFNFYLGDSFYLSTKQFFTSVTFAMKNTLNFSITNVFVAS